MIQHQGLLAYWRLSKPKLSDGFSYLVSRFDVQFKYPTPTRQHNTQVHFQHLIANLSTNSG